MLGFDAVAIFISQQVAILAPCAIEEEKRVHYYYCYGCPEEEIEN